VLDIAKFEPGEFTLNTAEYAIESVVETVRSATCLWMSLDVSGAEQEARLQDHLPSGRP
jgi:hypothetical protein